MGSLTVFCVLLAMGMTLPAAYRQYRTDRTGFIKTLKSLAACLFG